MKIAMLGHKRIPSREGGVEIVVEELSSRMVQLGNEVTCYNRSGKHVSNKEIKNSSLKVYKGIKLKKVITIDKKGLAAMTSSFFASLKILFSDAEIVHYHAEGPCAMMWLIKFFSKKRIIVTIHGLDWQRAKWGNFASKYIKFGEKMAVKFADEIIVLSKNVQEYFKKEYDRDTVFIPNGVNKPEILQPNIIKKKYKLKKDDYILFLGRMVPEKGIHYLIEAFNNIKTDKKLVIAGGSSDTDSYYKELKEMSKDNKNIIFTGFVEGNELTELYSNAYIYCLPSDLEGMPLSLLEAMSYGNCCLTSNIKECDEVIQDKGVTFEKSNVEDLEKSMIKLLKDENKVKKYKEESQDYILEKYNWDSVTDKTLDLYNKNDKNNIEINSKKKHVVDKINIAMFIIYLLVYVVTLVFFGMGTSIGNLRYYALALIIFISFISMILKYGFKVYSKKIYGKELLFTIFTAIIFLIFSFVEANNAGVSLPFRTFVQISLFLLPTLYTLNFINIFSMKKIFAIMKFTTIISIIMYFFHPDHTIVDFLNYKNWLEINFIDSISFTESNQFAEVFLQLFLFFYYFKNKAVDVKQRKSLKIFSIITFIFTILSFKRLGMLFAIVVIICNKFIKYSHKLSFKTGTIFAIVFTILTVIYVKFMQGQFLPYDEVFKITTGRNWILSLWESKDYLSYGYGSSMIIIGRYLELDLVQIFLELNIFALFLFCFTFFRLAKKNIYANLIMIYAFFNMLTASSLPWSLGWILMLITISCISSEKYEIENNTETKKIDKEGMNCQ